jgi:hypothetical protein
MAIPESVLHLSCYSLLTLLCHRVTRSLQPRRPLRADPRGGPLLRSIPPYQFGVEGRPGQPQRLRNADFVLQPRRCLSLADNALSLLLVTVQRLLLPI